jgi:recombination protein RecT
MAEAAAKPANPLVVLNTYLHDRVDSLKSALPPHIKPERFISSVMTAVQLNPDLLACDRRSLFIACMRCAQDGLLPDGTEAAIVPYKAKAQYIPMYQGLLKKFRNSGQFKWVTAGIAYEGEVYEHWIDENGEHFKHVPTSDSTERKIKRVYALATTKDGGFFIADLSMADINKRRAMSRASRDDAPWKQWPDEMMQKTAIRVLSKLLPKSSDLDAFLRADEEESLGVQAAETISDQRGEAFGNVLDHVAEGDASSSASPAAGTSNAAGALPGGEQDAGAGLGQSARDPAAAEDPVAVAYERGREARAANFSRKAIPGEYRDSARTREALAWEAGHAGAELPTFPA